MDNLPDWAVDDPEIDGPILMLRRVPAILVQDGVFESSCFRETEVDRGLSMTPWLSDQDLEDVLRDHDDFGVIAVAASALRAEGATIARCPIEGNANHCEVLPHFGKKAQRRLKRAAGWVHYPEWVAEEHRGDLLTRL